MQIGGFPRRCCFNRPFQTLDAASAALGAFEGGGHTSTDYLRLTWDTTVSARLSDYPVLFYFRSVLPRVKHLFDLGGHVGNMYYCYSRYIQMPEDLQWTVFDLPTVLE